MGGILNFEGRELYIYKYLLTLRVNRLTVYPCYGTTGASMPRATRKGIICT